MNKIAIIEDDIDICNMIAKFLENNKYIVHYALNGAEGIELCKSLVPDLIILDIMLPRLNGNDIELISAQELKEKFEQNGGNHD